ncbi:PD-(D/E)XK nuclease family protein [uncultured Tenacibaculum sp.]|uniref:PD-(D/E)XK nuclease family protein n=1 Tax=uncultured Tenacibaculum sp. TaxID=174713 RepID=UPI002609AA41|nr:PD-(D/E)XK nuclease family protein [uncultured Tenacibaculum sp.]
MNIFKILANGHGTVSETNVSAFLGYLLDPNADHGIGYEFLNLFLEEVLSEKNTSDETDFKPYQYDYQVFFEQKFKETNNNKSEAIDICIVCYETKNEGKSMSVMSDFISNNKEIKSVFLIENKIKGEPTKGQLSNQFLAFKDQFSEIKPDFNIDNIHSVYITPETIKFNNEFDTNTNKIQNKTHLHWNNNDDENNSIKKLLQEILIKEANYEIDPLNEYSKHTIKAFIQFINNNFKSIKEEKKERGKNDGSYTNRFIELNEETNINEKLNNLRDNLLTLDSDLNISKIDLSSPRFPKLNIPYKGIIIEIFTASIRRDVVKIIFRFDKTTKKPREKISHLAENLGVELKNSKSRNAYCLTQEMDRKLKISDTNKIFSIIQKSKKLIDENL